MTCLLQALLRWLLRWIVLLKDGARRKSCYWIYPFLICWRLNCRVATDTAQKLSGHLLSIRKNFVDHFVKTFSFEGVYQNVLLSMFLNIDEIAIYFVPEPKSTVHYTVARTISVRSLRRSNRRLTTCMLVASDGTKLPLLWIFKGRSNGRVEKLLHE